MTAATTRQPKEKKEMVTIHNMCAHPVFFRVPGKDVRIGPRSSMEIEKSFLNAAALQRLFRNNHVRLVEEEKTGEAGTETRATAHPAGSGRAVRRRPRARSPK